jgi:hypothetical protein
MCPFQVRPVSAVSKVSGFSISTTKLLFGIEMWIKKPARVSKMEIH